MRLPTYLLFSAFLLTAVLPARAQEGPPLPTSMNTLRASHPRLLILDSQLPSIKGRIAADSFAKGQYSSMVTESQALLSVPPLVYVLNGPQNSLMWTAREVEKRVLTLSGIYRLTGDRRFADRAIAEMLAATSFPDWDSKHLLVKAEMTAALGIGYDWLYPVLTHDQRETIKLAIIEKGISPFIGVLDHNQFHMHNNWAQVVYGAETVAALAIAEPNDDTSTALARMVLGYARPGIGAVMKLFAPDGGFEEGPVYWNYATIYNVLYIASLDTALGTDFGATDFPGFAETARYEIQANDPFYLYANFGDAHIDAYSASPQMFWFAQRFHQPLYALHERNLEQHLEKQIASMPPYEGLSRFEIMGLFWYSSAPPPQSATPLPLVEDFSRIAQVYMRTAWDDPNAWYVGFKGGDNGASHAHLDLGSFVLDAFGQRWAIDLGPDTYALPGYFARQRWNYYRTQTRSHNTIAINDQNQDHGGSAQLLLAGRYGQDDIAVLNLNGAYKDKLQSWKRGIAILGGHRVLVQDEIRPTEPERLIWHLQTPATVAIAADGRSATLHLADKTLHVAIVSPSGVAFSILPEHITPEETPNPGITDLVIDHTYASDPQVIAVLFSLKGESKTVRLQSLDDWGKE